MFVSDYRNARIAIFVFSLQECGRLRDEILSQLGVRLEGYLIERALAIGHNLLVQISRFPPGSRCEFLRQSYRMPSCRRLYQKAQSQWGRGRPRRDRRSPWAIDVECVAIGAIRGRLAVLRVRDRRASRARKAISALSTRAHSGMASRRQVTVSCNCAYSPILG